MTDGLVDTPETPQLALHLFGGLEILWGSECLHLGTHQGELALALLALHEGDISRADLADRLWPGQTSSVSQKMQNLRKQLEKLRRTLPPVVSVRLQESNEGRLYRMRLDTNEIMVDALRFNQLYDQGMAHGNVDILKQALALYKGELLHGYNNSYVRALRIQYFSRVWKILEYLEDTGYPSEADFTLHFLEKWFVANPGDETVARRLMEIYGSREQIDRVKHIYKTVQEAVRRGHPESMDRATEILYREITTTRQRSEGTPLPSSGAERVIEIPVPMRLIGRNTDIARISTLLTSDRLVALVGPGGVGKTRVAECVAASVVEKMRDGAVFVDLTTMPLDSPPEMLAATIAQTIEGAVVTARIPDALERLNTILQFRILLLVLDNVEHVLSATRGIVRSILRACKGIRILTTGLDRILLPMERVYLLKPLSLPPLPTYATMESILDSEAVQLFLERIPDPDFHLDHQNARALSQICHDVEGLPFALELAAAHVGSQIPLEFLAQQLHQDPSSLDTPTRYRADHPLDNRHLSLNDTLAWSYRLLSSDEQYTLRSMTVLISGGSAEAIQTIAGQHLGALASHLLALRHRGLIAVLPEATDVPNRSRTPYYRLPFPLRQFLMQDVLIEETKLFQRRHLHYFAGFAERWSAEPERLTQDRSNLQDALRFALTLVPPDVSSTPEDLAENIAHLVIGLWQTGMTWGGLPIIYNLLEPCEEILLHVPDPLRIRGLKSIGNAAYLMQEYTPAYRCFLACFATSQSSGNLREEAAALGNLGNIAMAQHQYDVARTNFLACATTFRQIGNLRGEALALDNLANLERDQGNLEDAFLYHRDCISLLRVLEDPLNLGISLNNFGYTLVRASRWEEAVSILRDALTLSIAHPLPRVLSQTLSILQEWTIGTARFSEGAHFMGAEAALREAHHLPLPPDQERVWHLARRRLERELGPSLFQEIFSQGRILAQAPDTLMTVALHMLDR